MIANFNIFYAKEPTSNREAKILFFFKFWKLQIQMFVLFLELYLKFF